jgi:hypothetical protein
MVGLDGWSGANKFLKTVTWHFEGGCVFAPGPQLQLPRTNHSCRPFDSVERSRKLMIIHTAAQRSAAFCLVVWFGPRPPPFHVPSTSQLWQAPAFFS